MKTAELVTLIIKECSLTDVMFGIAMTESSGNELAESYCARGLTQITHSTLQDINKLAGTSWSFNDLFKPEISLRAGEFYVNHLQKNFSSEALTILAYSWGIGNVKTWLKLTKPDNRFIDESIPVDKKNYLYSFLWWKNYFCQVTKPI